MGWIEKNGSKYYKLTKTVGRKLNAFGNEVPVKKEFYGKTKKECVMKYQEFLDNKKQGLESQKQYFGILADSWINEFFVYDGNVKDSTKKLYLNAWDILRNTELYHLPLNEVSAKTIQKTYNLLYKQGTTSTRINNINKIMRKLYKYLDMQGFSRDVTSSLTVPRESKPVAAEKEIIVWEDDEIRAILNGFEKAHDSFRLRFLIVMAYYTGCRISELLALKYEDINSDYVRIDKQLSNDINDNLVISTPKSNTSIRNIPINSNLLDELKIHTVWHKKEMLKNGYRTNYIFTSDSGEWLNRKNIQRACERYYKRINVPYKKFHSYRHTFGTNLCKSGIPIQTASVLLGHADISVTAKYYVNVSISEKELAIKKLSDIINY